jgi:hypothetical protein
MELVWETIESSLPSTLLRPLTGLIGHNLISQTTDLRIELSTLNSISSEYHSETKQNFNKSYSPTLHTSFIRSTLESRIKTLLESVAAPKEDVKSVVDWMFVQEYLNERPESRASSTASSIDESVILELSRGGGLDFDEWKRIGKVLRYTYR